MVHNNNNQLSLVQRPVSLINGRSVNQHTVIKHHRLPSSKGKRQEKQTNKHSCISFFNSSYNTVEQVVPASNYGDSSRLIKQTITPIFKQPEVVTDNYGTSSYGQSSPNVNIERTVVLPPVPFVPSPPRTPALIRVFQPSPIKSRVLLPKQAGYRRRR